MKKSAPSPPHELVRARQGAECVYWGKGYIIHAVLGEIRSDKWGVRLMLRDLESPGFTGRARPHAENPFWEVGATWDMFYCSEESWSGSYVSWSVHFSPPLIGALREAARGVAGADWRSRVEALGSRYRAHRRND